MSPSSTLSKPSEILDRLLTYEADDAVLSYLVDYVSAILKAPPGKDIVISVSRRVKKKRVTTRSSSKGSIVDGELPDPVKFIRHVFARGRCTMATALAAIVYLGKLRHIIADGSSMPEHCPDTLHRIVFTAVMMSHKIWNDASMVGKHWACVTEGIFTASKVLAMEIEFLSLLGHNVNITEEEVWSAARPFLRSPFITVSTAELRVAENTFLVKPRQKREKASVDQLVVQCQDMQIHPYSYLSSSGLLLTCSQALVTSPAATQTYYPSQAQGTDLIHPHSSWRYSTVIDSNEVRKCGGSSSSDSSSSSPDTLDPLLANGYSPLNQSPPPTPSSQPSQVLLHPKSGSETGFEYVKPLLYQRSPLSATVSSAPSPHHPTRRHQPALHPAARLKKKRQIALKQVHLASSTNSESRNRQARFFLSPPSSGRSVCENSSSEYSVSIPSSPSVRSASSGPSIYSCSPEVAWYARMQAQQRFASIRQPPYSYVSKLPLAGIRSGYERVG